MMPENGQLVQDPKLAALRDLEQRGREALDRENPPAWLPWKDESQPHEIAAALITRIDPHVGPSAVYGTYSAVVSIVDTEGRSWALWANKPDSALWQQIKRLQLQVGDAIALRYEGKRASKRDSNKTVKDVRLVRIENETELRRVDYDALDSPHDSIRNPEEEPSNFLPKSGEDDIPF